MQHQIHNQQPIQHQQQQEAASLLPSPPLLNPLSANRARLKRSYSSDYNQPSTLVSIEESPWGEAVADAFSSNRASSHHRGRLGGVGVGFGVGGEGDVGLGMDMSVLPRQKRHRPDITPQFASLSLQPDAQPFQQPPPLRLSPPAPALLPLPSQQQLHSEQLQPAAQGPGTQPVTPPLQQGSSHLLPGFTSAAGLGPGAVPTPSPPHPSTIDYAHSSQHQQPTGANLAEARMDDSSPPSSVPTSPQFRPMAGVPPMSPVASMRALPLAVERLRSPVLGSPNTATEGRRLRRPPRTTSSLLNDANGDAIMPPSGASSFNISPHRVYVASLDDSDDESDSPPPQRRGPTVLNAPGLKRTMSTKRHLPPSPLPDSLITPTQLPPGTGELILYRPLTFGQQKGVEEDEAAAAEGKKGEQWDEYLRERQTQKMEADRGRREMMQDGAMDDDEDVEEIVVEGNSEEGMDLDG